MGNDEMGEEGKESQIILRLLAKESRGDRCSDNIKRLLISN